MKLSLFYGLFLMGCLLSHQVIAQYDDDNNVDVEDYEGDEEIVDEPPIFEPMKRVCICSISII